ncbi:aminoglycoside phosphotransferase family protein [Kribbella sp. NPDC051770]|uniref:aminoglycoside phosphotransferase family protein n=1 Tax=Kribbella sp. NPDC051770 TaxID=3155413 RepID=UPI00342AD30C
MSAADSDHTGATVTAVVIRPGDEAVLVLPTGLPRVELPEEVWFPDVDRVVRAFREQLGIEAVVLECLAAEGPAYLMVAEGNIPAGARWVSGLDHPLVTAAGKLLARPAGSPLLPPWTRPEWYDDALAWIDEQVEHTGPLQQVRSWGLSNVFRVPEGVYFKAITHSSTVVPDHADARPLLFAHEPAFLQRLSAERPGLVVEPLAVDEKRAWMLLPDLGEPLAVQDDLDQWSTAIRTHAQLQRSYVDSPDALLAMSCTDRRLNQLEAAIDDVLGANELTADLTPAERDQLATRGPALREAIAELAAIGVPETLLHGDLHPRNIAVQDGRALAFDWTDACLSHPFLDLVTFVEGRSPHSRDPQVLDAYLTAWLDYAPMPALRRALELANEIGALHQAVTYLHLVDNLSGPSRASMRSGGVWWLRKIATGERPG